MGRTRRKFSSEEKMAVVKYVLTHKNFLYGYRYLAWQMIDENVAFVRPASVYNIMKEYDLVHKEECPSLARQTIEKALKQLCDSGKLKKQGSGSRTFYVRVSE